MLSTLLAVAATGCGGGAASGPPTVAGPELARALGGPKRTCTAGSLRRLGSARAAYAAVVRTHARAYRRPGRVLLAGFGALNENGVPTVFGVLGAVVDAACKPRWYRVELPMRPNGASAARRGTTS